MMILKRFRCVRVLGIPECFSIKREADADHHEKVPVFVRKRAASRFSILPQ